jgi:hypothetical protein
MLLFAVLLLLRFFLLAAVRWPRCEREACMRYVRGVGLDLIFLLVRFMLILE